MHHTFAQIPNPKFMVMTETSTFGIFRGRNIRGRNVQAETSMAEMFEHHLCAELTAVSWLIEPIEEVGANFSLQHSSRTQFAKIKNKELIIENQCENIKNHV